MLNRRGIRPPPGLERREICDLASITIGSTECNLTDSEWFLVDEGGPDPETLSNAEAVEWIEIDPGVWMVPAVPLPTVPENLQVSVGEDILPSQLYCHFSEGTDRAIAGRCLAHPLFITTPQPREPEISPRVGIGAQFANFAGRNLYGGTSGRLAIRISQPCGELPARNQVIRSVESSPLLARPNSTPKKCSFTSSSWVWATYKTPNG